MAPDTSSAVELRVWLVRLRHAIDSYYITSGNGLEADVVY